MWTSRDEALEWCRPGDREVERRSVEIMEWFQYLKMNRVVLKPTLLENVRETTVLCILANTLQPGSIRKFHRRPRMLAMKLENCAFFLACCKKYFGLPQEYWFSPTDLFDDSWQKVIPVLLFLMGKEEPARNN
eukprot:TRINITY_DN7888_c0_g1_i1.p2 TRINITY_DN7888_c0_g1~~TRINITY_DN7888_c0_g1_i1.p2  ORF type:complete len:133 (+),score=30.32 TRINITY_DN7888_c0_g1_i1:15-413(+)